MDTRKKVHQMNGPQDKRAAYSWAKQISYTQVYDLQASTTTNNCMITKLVLVWKLLQLFLKHAIKAELILLAICQHLAKYTIFKITNLHSLIIITPNTKCDCVLHYIFCSKLVWSLFIWTNCPPPHYLSLFL